MSCGPALGDLACGGANSTRKTGVWITDAAARRDGGVQRNSGQSVAAVAVRMTFVTAPGRETMDRCAASTLVVSA